MENCFDKLEYRSDRILMVGWAVPQAGGKPLQVEVLNENGSKLDISHKMIRRSDVGLLKLNDRDMDMYGYYVEFPYEPLKKASVRFWVEGEEPLCVEISPLQLYLKYKRETGLAFKLLRYLKSSDKKNFWINEKYRLCSDRDRKYNIWYEQHTPDRAKLDEQRGRQFAENPFFSLLIPVYRPKFKHFKEMIESVRKQTYGNWEICLAYNGTPDDEIGKYISTLTEESKKIKAVFLKKNYGIAGNTNKAMELAAGDWIVFADQDDIIREDALYEYARAIHMRDADVLYCDEDKLDDETGFHFDPHFKPDFNPDLLYCTNYVCHMLVVRRSYVEKAGALKPSMDGAQDYDYVLRLSELTDRFAHISKMLYSWRSHQASTAMDPESKMYAFLAGKKALEEHYDRVGIKAVVSMLKIYGWYRTDFVLSKEPLVSVIIPNKDHREDLLRCVNSLRDKLTYKNIEIIIAENNSTERETFELYKELMKDPAITVINWDEGFNYAAINNYAVTHAKGDYLLFLNNDTEVISPGLIESMLGYCMRDNVGAVGARLIFDNDTIQHAGILVGVRPTADPVFVNLDKDAPGYMGRAVVSQDMSAVTAACMMVKTALYRELGGMEESLAVAYNDVDFCLKLRKAGYLVVYDAFAEMYHYESRTRGYDDSEEKMARLEKERKILCSRWPDAMNGDPYYNRNLSLDNGYYEI